jgi:hypothetical protein
VSIKVVTADELNNLGTSLGVPYDPSASFLIAFVDDCGSTLAPGVQITTNPPYPTAREIYGLSNTLTATDSNGFASFAALPAGSIDVIATPLALGKASSHHTVNVRPGWVTDVGMFPTP